MNHSDYIHRCLELAEQGRGATGINPIVGSVLVRGESSIAESFHSAFGGDHAERELIKKVEQDILPTDELYVNVEPCSHYGKTPPCTQAIIDAGIKTVVYGMQDPNPEVSGKGIAALRDAGVKTIGPIDPELCRRANRGFVSLQEQGRPWITLKRAQTKQGKIANDNGSRLCITSDKQNAWSHEFLRAKHDAILVGVKTVIADNPLLTVRLNKKVVQNNRLRIVLDPHARTPSDSRILCEGTCIVIAENADVPLEIERSGAWILRMAYQNDQFNLHALLDVLTTPAEGYSGVSSILVEGGHHTWKSFKDARLCDEEVVLVG